MSKQIIKEYMLSHDELAAKFPIGANITIDGKPCIVVRYLEPQASNCMASYPRVVFEENTFEPIQYIDEVFERRKKQKEKDK